MPVKIKLRDTVIFMLIYIIVIFILSIVYRDMILLYFTLLNILLFTYVAYIIMNR